MAGTRRMPAEWEPHERTLIQWPVRRSLIHPENNEEVCAGYAAAARAVAEFEPVTVVAAEDTAGRAERLCGGRAEIFTAPHSDAWVRDSGPTVVLEEDGARLGVRWRFNAWGGKYAPCEPDHEAARAVLKHLGIPRADAPIVLEGGSIHTDGERTLLTTEQCLLNPNRNPDLSREMIGETLREFLGVKKVIWLNRGLAGDETDGHVDNIACFARPGTVLLQVCDDPEDENCEITGENRKILNTARDAAGRPLQVIEIPQPPVRCFDGTRLTLSYLNFYLVNGGVVLPVFGGDARKTDEAAVKILQEVFPDRRIRTVDGIPLVREGGNIHCITQQIPAAGSGGEEKAE
ncbi:agmatine deiminase family protein [Caproiciproducens sp. NJN-50]|uniref:agmatine deiminase family protein n=1 Tax=Acutalibacteraceae TaxID=3082771 RepID=UPI000FFDFD3B|nr:MULTISPECIES: agmatine deiminase family protein [Acutalibacteraceae]QAT48487.1 agmatine deiminase family protein [Caproiciproducens sp. NJN-50]